LTVAGVPRTSARSTSKPTIELLTNPRAGTLGVSLATAVAQPALAHASRQIGQRLLALSSAVHSSDAERLLLKDPLSVTAVPYRPLPSHSAGLTRAWIASGLGLLFCRRESGTVAPL
jgi:hypothetical protein